MWILLIGQWLALATEKEFRQSRTSQACESEANLTWLVHLVAFVCLIDSGNLVSFVQSQNQTRPGNPDNSLLQLESVFGVGWHFTKRGRPYGITARCELHSLFLNLFRRNQISPSSQTPRSMKTAFRFFASLACFHIDDSCARLECEVVPDPFRHHPHPTAELDQ